MDVVIINRIIMYNLFHKTYWLLSWWKSWKRIQIYCKCFHLYIKLRGHWHNGAIGNTFILKTCMTIQTKTYFVIVSRSVLSWWNLVPNCTDITVPLFCITNGRQILNNIIMLDLVRVIKFVSYNIVWLKITNNAWYGKSNDIWYL